MLTRKSKLSVLLVVLTLLMAWNLFALFRTLDQSEGPAIAEGFGGASIYKASPVEATLLEANKKLWPRLFGPQFPIEAPFIPRLYSTLETRDYLGRLSIKDFQLARKWSILTNTLQLEGLRIALFEKGVDFKPRSFNGAMQAGLLKKSSECALIRQEKAFRIAQLIPEYRNDAAAMLSRCSNGELLSGIWLEVELALEAKDKKKLAAYTEKLGVLRAKGEEGFRRWWADRIWSLLRYNLAHSGDEDSETSVKIDL